MIKKILLGALTVSTLFFTSCSKDKDKVITTKTIKQVFTNLPDLGPNYVYEGWITYAGKEVSTGRFTSKQGEAQKAVPLADFIKATNYFLTIEPANETGEALASPSKFIFSGGAFVKGKATSSTQGVFYKGTSNLTKATGQFFLKAPSKGSAGEDKNGIWFIDAIPPTTGGFVNLPTLNANWIYEGWVVVNDKNGKAIPISTGTFSDPAKADSNNNEFKGTGDVPPFPGEDFIVDTAERFPDVTFPVDLSNAKVVISIEPVQDDSPNPFGLKPFSKQLTNQAPEVAVSMDNAFSKPVTGTVTSF